MLPIGKVLMTTEAGADWVLRLLKVVVIGTLSLMVCAPPPVLGADAQPQYSCLNTKSGTIVNRAQCQKGEKRFSSASYTKKIQSVDKKVSTLRKRVSNLKASLEDVPQPARVLHVATSGTDYQTVESALLAATQLSPTASNPVLVKIAPGSYALASTNETIPSHVSLEGSGVGVTRLRSNGSEGITLSNLARLSRLTITATNGSPSTLVRFATAGGAASIEDLAIEVDSSPSFRIGVFVLDGILYGNRIRIDADDSVNTAGMTAIAVAGDGARFEGALVDINLKSSVASSVRGMEVADGAGATLRDSMVRVFTSGAGAALPFRVGQTSQSVLFRNVRAVTEWSESNEVLFVTSASGVVVENSSFESEVSVGTFGNGVVVVNGGGEVQIRNSTIITPDGYKGVSAYDAGSSLKVMGSFLAGAAGVASGGAVVTCSGVTDEAYVFYPSTCPS